MAASVALYVSLCLCRLIAVVCWPLAWNAEMVKAAYPCNPLAGTQGCLAKGTSVPSMRWWCHLWCNHHEPCDPLGCFLDGGIRHSHITWRLISTSAVSGLLTFGLPKIDPHGEVFALGNFSGVQAILRFWCHIRAVYITQRSSLLKLKGGIAQGWLAPTPAYMTDNMNEESRLGEEGTLALWKVHARPRVGSHTPGFSQLLPHSNVARPGRDAGFCSHTVFKNLATNTNDLEILDPILGGEGIIQLNWGFMMEGKRAGKGCRVTPSPENLDCCTQGAYQLSSRSE